MFAQHHADIEDNGGYDKNGIDNVVGRNRDTHTDGRPLLLYGKQAHRARHVVG